MSRKLRLRHNWPRQGARRPYQRVLGFSFTETVSFGVCGAMRRYVEAHGGWEVFTAKLSRPSKAARRLQDAPRRLDARELGRLDRYGM